MSAIAFGDGYNPYECPITEKTMRDLVLTPCGHTFDRVDLLSWIAQNPTCPECRAEVLSDQLIPNRALAAAIERLPKETLENLTASQESQESKSVEESATAQKALRAAQEESPAARTQMRAMEPRGLHQNAPSHPPLCERDTDDELAYLIKDFAQEAEQFKRFQDQQRASTQSNSTVSSEEGIEVLAVVVEHLEREQEARAVAEAAKWRIEQKAKMAKYKLEASQRARFQASSQDWSRRRVERRKESGGTGAFDRAILGSKLQNARSRESEHLEKEVC